MSIEDKAIFCKPEEERAVLSFAIRKMDYFYDVQSKTEEDDFLYPEHKILYVLLKHLANRGAEKFDLSLILSTAKDMQVLTQIGGLDYVSTIAGMRISDSNYELYLKEVLEASTKYKLYNILREKTNYLVDNAKTELQSSDLIGAVENNILDLSTKSRAVAEPIDFTDGLGEYLEERRVNAVDYVGISTGFPILNRQIDGLIPGTLFIIAARKKVGKSAFLTNMAARIAYNDNIPVLYIDTELSFNEWRPRVISAMSRVEERSIKRGGFSTDQNTQLVERCLQVSKKGLLFHEYMPGYSVDKIVALYKKYKAKHNLGLIVFDYLKEPESSSLDRQRKEYQVLGDVTTKLKDLAGELNVPAITAVQLNRSGDVADSDRIARYGDIVAFWQAKTPEEIQNDGPRSGSHKLVIRDTRRGGATGERGISYFFFKKMLLIKEVKPPQQPVQYTEGDVIDNESANFEDFREEYEDDELI